MTHLAARDSVEGVAGAGRARGGGRHGTLLACDMSASEKSEKAKKAITTRRTSAQTYTHTDIHTCTYTHTHTHTHTHTPMGQGLQEKSELVEAT